MLGGRCRHCRQAIS
ncbi:hypothetical protein [Candidatus Pantoea persica]|nr:hypothetical protein [Candidatus Pantoea persica]